MHSQAQGKIRLLSFVPYGAWAVHNQVDAMLAMTLRARGAEVLAVGCDGLFPRCYTLVRAPDPQAACAACAAKGAQFFKDFGLPFTQLRGFIQAGEFESARAMVQGLNSEELFAFQFDGLALGKAVAPSVCSYLRIPTNKLATAEACSVHQEFLAYAIVTTRALQRIFDAFRPTHLSLFNGFGFSHSAAFLLAQQRGLDIVAHERGYHDGSFMLTSNEACASLRPMVHLADLWTDVPLTADEVQRMKQFFINREFGRDINHFSFYDFHTDHAEVRRQLRIPIEAKVLGVFTSTEYELIYVWDDAQAVARQMDVIDRLIEEFRDREEYLVIRHHPNIGGGPAGAPPDTRLLTRAYRQAACAPANVRIIMPDERISSYALLWHVDAAIAFFSTVRLEVAARGVPTASSAIEPVYRGLTHRIDDESPEGLRRLVKSLFDKANNFKAADLRDLYRAAYSLFFRHSTKFKSFQIANNSEVKINISSVQELLPGNDPALDRVCDYIEKGQSLYPKPSELDRARGDREELQLLEAELAEVRSYRNQVRTKAAQTPAAPQPPVAIFAEQSEISRHQFEAQWYEGRVHCASGGGVELRSQAPYTLIADSRCYYDQAFLSEAVAMLEQNRELEGVFSEAWLRDASGEIEGRLFRRANSPKTWQDLKALLGPHADRDLLLGLGVWRTSALADLLALHTPAALGAETVWERMSSPRCGKISAPLVVISEREGNLRPLSGVCHELIGA